MVISTHNYPNSLTCLTKRGMVSTYMVNAIVQTLLPEENQGWFVLLMCCLQWMKAFLPLQWRVLASWWILQRGCSFFSFFDPVLFILLFPLKPSSSFFLTIWFSLIIFFLFFSSHFFSYVLVFHYFVTTLVYSRSDCIHFFLFLSVK